MKVIISLLSIFLVNFYCKSQWVYEEFESDLNESYRVIENKDENGNSIRICDFDGVLLIGIHENKKYCQDTTSYVFEFTKNKNHFELILKQYGWKDGYLYFDYTIENSILIENMENYSTVNICKLNSDDCLTFLIGSTFKNFYDKIK